MIKKIIGLFLIALPFVIIFIGDVATKGWKQALANIGAAAFVAASIGVGLSLLNNKKSGS